MMSKYMVSWIGGDDLGVYEADNEAAAIEVAVKDAGYVSMERAADFIRDADGNLTLQAVPQVNAQPGKIKVVAQHAWEIVGTREEAVAAAEQMEKNGCGVAKFEWLDDDCGWIEVSLDDL